MVDQPEDRGRRGVLPRLRRMPRSGVAGPPKHPGPSSWVLPHPSRADEDGVVGVGADLAPATLVQAYSSGLFPWPHDDAPLPWFSPDPRAVMTIHDLHVQRSLRRTARRSGWTTTCDAAFDDVMDGCAQRRDEGTWITDAMRGAYRRLHDLGWAHSIEVWDDDDLVGGIYGIQIGATFTGESMFHRRSDASKIALWELLLRLTEAGGTTLDAQLWTPHLATLGIREIPRDDYLARLQDGASRPVGLLRSRRDTWGMAGRHARFVPSPVQGS